MSGSAVAPWQSVWLLVLWAALLFGGFIFGSPSSDGSRRMPTWTRMGSSLVLVIAAWSWYAFSTGRATPFPLLIAAGMSLGFLGDLFMAGLLPVGKRVLWGMGAFGLGHVAYIAAIISYGNRYGFPEPEARWGAWLLLAAVGVLGWYLVVYRGGKPGILQWAALPYALLLASTAGFACGLALQARAFVPLAIGAVLFLVSDLILAARLFNGLEFPLSDDVVWLTYGPAQMLIVYSIGRALELALV